MIDRPSEKEEDFFKRQEFERLRKARQEKDEKLKAAEREKRKKEHWMKCPKCGMDLTEIAVRDIKVDKCFSCEGIFLDKGELEALMASNDFGMVKRITKLFLG
jgi:hypothetical protein